MVVVGAYVSEFPHPTGDGHGHNSWVDCSTSWWQVLTQFWKPFLFCSQFLFLFGVANPPAGFLCFTAAVATNRHFARDGCWPTAATITHHCALTDKLPRLPLPERGTCVSLLGLWCEFDARNNRRHPDVTSKLRGLACPPVSEATGYGNLVWFTPGIAPQRSVRWPAPARPLLRTAHVTNPEDRAPLGWGAELEFVCGGYQASTGSSSIELRHGFVPDHVSTGPQSVSRPKSRMHQSHLQGTCRLWLVKPRQNCLSTIFTLTRSNILMPSKSRLAGARRPAVMKTKRRTGLRAAAPVQKRAAPRVRMARQSVRNTPAGMSRGSGWDGIDLANASPAELAKRSWSLDPATSNLMAPRGLGYYDAFANHPTTAATHMSIGPATPIIAKTRIPSKEMPGGIETGLVPLLLVVGPAPSSTQAKLYYRSSAVDTDFIDSVAFQASALPTQPVNPFGPPDETYLAPGGDLQEVIPVRCSVRVRNYTAEINRGGQVHVLRMTTGFAIGIGKVGTITTNAELDEFLDSIRDHARTRTYDGCDFTGVGLQKNCTVADQSRSLMFQNFNQSIVSSDVSWAPAKVDVSGTPEVYPVYPVDQYHYDPTFTPIAYLFEPFINVQPGSGGSVGNTYGITVQSQFLAHYKQGTMLANMAFNPAHDKDGKTLNKHREKEESWGSSLHKVMDIITPVIQQHGPTIARFGQAALAAM